MVIECVAPPSRGAVVWAMDWLSQNISEQGKVALSQRPWIILNASNKTHLYLPALSGLLRKKASAKELLWVSCPLQSAPFLVQKFLESSLCAGVLVLNLDSFAKSSPAAIWGRRWQLASEKGDSTLIWLHSKKTPMMGVDIKLEWVEPGKFVISKGQHILEKKEKIKHGQTKCGVSYVSAA